MRVEVGGKAIMNVNDLAAQVKETIGRLDDEGLLRMVEAPAGEYTPEAVRLAHAEMEKRGGKASVEQKAAELRAANASTVFPVQPFTVWHAGRILWSLGWVLLVTW